MLHRFKTYESVREEFFTADEVQELLSQLHAVGLKAEVPNDGVPKHKIARVVVADDLNLYFCKRGNQKFYHLENFMPQGQPTVNFNKVLNLIQNHFKYGGVLKNRRVEEVFEDVIRILNEYGIEAMEMTDYGLKLPHGFEIVLCGSNNNYANFYLVSPTGVAGNITQSLRDIIKEYRQHLSSKLTNHARTFEVFEPRKIDNREEEAKRKKILPVPPRVYELQGELQVHGETYEIDNSVEQIGEEILTDDLDAKLVFAVYGKVPPSKLAFKPTLTRMILNVDKGVDVLLESHDSLSFSKEDVAGLAEYMALCVVSSQKSWLEFNGYFEDPNTVDTAKMYAVWQSMTEQIKKQLRTI